MGIRIRYLPNKDETLWFGGRFLISVVMEYVLPLIRTSTLLKQYFPRLCRFKSDAKHSHETRLQDVPHVCSPEHWGDGSVLAVRPTLLSFSVTGFPHTTE